MNKILAMAAICFFTLLSGSVMAITVSNGDVVVYDPSDPPELVGELGPDIYSVGFTFTDPSQGFLITLNAPSDLSGTLDWAISSGPNATGLGYASESILPGDSNTISMGFPDYASESNPITAYFSMVAYGLSSPIPFGGSSGSNIIAPQVPVPPAVWLFGSGLLGLAGISRRKSI